MRVDLKVPFAEKDAAKKLGAQWDTTLKIWYVTGKDDLAPFSKWSPKPHASSNVTAVPQKLTQAKTQESGNVFVGSNYVEHPRVCECLPWDVCDKCHATALSIK